MLCEILTSMLCVQVAMQANVPQPSHDEDETDDVDEDLKKLQISLEGGAGGAGWGNVTEDPSIQDYLQYYKWEKIRKKYYLVKPKIFPKNISIHKSEKI